MVNWGNYYKYILWYYQILEGVSIMPEHQNWNWHESTSLFDLQIS